jgi:hypothetical protein
MGSRNSRNQGRESAILKSSPNLVTFSSSYFYRYTFPVILDNLFASRRRRTGP